MAAAWCCEIWIKIFKYLENVRNTKILKRIFSVEYLDEHFTLLMHYGWTWEWICTSCLWPTAPLLSSPSCFWKSVFHSCMHVQYDPEQHRISYCSCKSKSCMHCLWCIQLFDSANAQCQLYTQWFSNTGCKQDYSVRCVYLLFFDSEAQYMIVLFMVFVVQFSVSSACLAINREQQVRGQASLSPLKQLSVA